MKKPWLLFASLALGTAAAPPPRAAENTLPAAAETIVMIRHGEKPEGGLGQLSCRGLNRALALPAVLGRDFGRPNAIFAPDPAVRKSDYGQSYDYVRPLATIEPAAIAFTLPVDVSIGYDDIAALQKAVEAPALAHATVLIAWEHTALVALARALAAAHHADPTKIPDWNKDDFDGIYVLRITPATATFERRTEGLDGLSAGCPY